MVVHDGTIEDVQTPVIHHRKMFEEIFEQKGLKIEISRARELEAAYIEKITKQIPEGICKAWIIKV
jgi:hypothetical protein